MVGQRRRCELLTSPTSMTSTRVARRNRCNNNSIMRRAADRLHDLLRKARGAHPGPVQWRLSSCPPPARGFDQLELVARQIAPALRARHRRCRHDLSHVCDESMPTTTRSTPGKRGPECQAARERRYAPAAPLASRRPSKGRQGANHGGRRGDWHQQQALQEYRADMNSHARGAQVAPASRSGEPPVEHVTGRLHQLGRPRAAHTSSVSGS